MEQCGDFTARGGLLGLFWYRLGHRLAHNLKQHHLSNKCIYFKIYNLLHHSYVILVFSSPVVPSPKSLWDTYLLLHFLALLSCPF